jgi:RNA polymerase sigma-70 factor (ECF subfamily)
MINQELMKLYKSKYRYAFALEFTKDHDDALDLMQDTYVKIMNKRSYYVDRGNGLHGWIKVVMKRIHLNNVRRDGIKERALMTYEDKYKPQEAHDSTDLVYCKQLIKVCRHKEILKLQALGYRAEDISEITGINKNTVFSKWRYMRDHLRKYK